jgi:glutaredoxin
VALAVAALAALGGGACRKAAPEAPPVSALALPPLEVAREGGTKWLYTYADPDGRFVTVDDAKSIPEGSRRLVRVTDPAGAAGDHHDGLAVYAIDAQELLNGGKTKAKVLSRSAFETGALAQLPPGESSAWPAAAPAGNPAQEPPAPPAAAGAPVVTIYGTSWCTACRAARQYLSARKIPYAEKDIEKDPAAARELEAKAARLGVPTDRVPIIEVRGRLLLGFDQRRLEALLGEAT